MLFAETDKNNLINASGDSKKSSFLRLCRNCEWYALCIRKPS